MRTRALFSIGSGTELFSARNCTGIINLLIAHNIDLEARDIVGRTQLRLATEYEAADSIEERLNNVRCVLQHETSMIDARDNKGDSAAVKACYWNHADLLSLIASSGVTLDNKNENSQSILNVVAWEAGAGVVRTLADLASHGKMARINLNAKHNGHDPWTCFDTCRKGMHSEAREEGMRERKAFADLLDTKKQFQR